MSVGNDVVDLADPESRLDGLHPRWGERVFAASERAALERASAGREPERAGVSSDRHRLHWALWAAKESAYKARKRDDPGTGSSPREFVVELSPLPTEDGIAVGRVLHRGQALAVEVRFDGACLHAVATSAEAAEAPSLTAVATADGEPSRHVRRLAAEAIGDALHIDPTRLHVKGRPPVVLLGSLSLDVILSLSHHGRFVAFACAPPSGSRTT